MFFRILAVLFAVYLFLIFIPAVISYFCVFRRVPGNSIRTKDYRGTYYETFLPLMEEKFTALEKLPLKEVFCRSSDGTELRGRFLDRGSDRLAILFHGFRSTSFQDFCFVFEDLMDDGFDLLFVDERATGKSGGKRSTMGAREADDVLSWVRFSKEALHREKLLLYGISMGGTAVGLSSDRLPGEVVKGLVIDAAFSCPDDQIGRTGKERHLPVKAMSMPMALAVKLDQGIGFHDRVSHHLSETEIPVLFLYGTEDSTVPVSDFKEMYEACASEKFYIEAAGAEHTLAYPVSSEEGKKKLFEFTEHCFRGENP